DEVELAREVAALELLVLADVRGGHPTDAPGREQDAESPVVDAAVVRDDVEVAGALLEQRLDERHRRPGQAEAADRDGRPVRDVRDRLGRTRHGLVGRHHSPACARGDVAGSIVSLSCGVYTASASASAE